MEDYDPTEPPRQVVQVYSPPTSPRQEVVYSPMASPRQEFVAVLEAILERERRLADISKWNCIREKKAANAGGQMQQGSSVIDQTPWASWAGF